MFRIITLFIAVLTLTGIYSSKAQSDTELEPGISVVGEITNSEYEVPFTFQGKADSVIIIEMKPVDPLGDLNRPLILLIDSNGDIVADTSEAFSLTYALLAVQIPHDDLYTIIATREDGRAGDSVGDFTIELIVPISLELNSPVSDEITSEDRTQYYLIDGIEIPFAFWYSKSGGEFAPEVAINRIDSDFSLLNIASMTGDELATGSLGIQSTRDPLLVTISEAPFDFNFNEVRAEFTIELRNLEE